MEKYTRKKYNAGGTQEMVLWATKIGEPDWEEKLITNNPLKIEEAKKWALANGFDRIRVAKINMSEKPDFRKTFDDGGGVDFSERQIVVAYKNGLKASYFVNKRNDGYKIIRHTGSVEMPFGSNKEKDFKDWFKKNTDSFEIIYATGGALIGNQSKIDMNKNNKIDAEDFVILRKSMNGAWRNEHKHVNSTSRKDGKVIQYEVRYARKNNPSRTGYRGKQNFDGGGFVDWRENPTKKVRGTYQIKGKNIDIVAPIVFFEREDDENYSIYPSDEYKDIFRSIKVKSTALNSIDKGHSVRAELNNGTKVTIKRILSTFENGGYTDLSKAKANVINESNPKDTALVPEIDIENVKKINLYLNDNKIRDVDDAVKVFQELFDKNSINAYEEVKVLYLDNNNVVIGVYSHSKGGINGTVVDVEMISALAVKCLAKGVIMCHNHPSGSLRFSEADKTTSKNLKNALNLFSIVLMDSIVITNNGFISMSEEGIFLRGGSVKFNTGGSFKELKFKDLLNKRFDIEIGSGVVGSYWNDEEKLLTKIKDCIKHNLFDSGFYYNWTNNEQEYKNVFEKDTLEPMLKNVDKTLTDFFIFNKREYPNTDTLKFKMNVKERTNWIDNWFKNNKLISKSLKKDYYDYREKYAGVNLFTNDSVKYFDGGNVTFKRKAKSIAKKFEGQKVEPKYQQEYGKRYDKAEAQEVGKKIAGKMKAMGMEKKAFGGFFGKSAIKTKPHLSLDEKQVMLKNGDFVQVLDHSGDTLLVMDLNKIGSGIPPKKISITEVEESYYNI